ncbi:MAG: pyridoxal phosphate-dependent aminotransferase [Acidimicrobiales bacterium]|jgi:aspartate/methionine/tyrosine aminotransferase
MSADPQFAPGISPVAPADAAGGNQSGVSRRIGGVEASATLAIDAKAKALQEAGVDVISFGAGEPDFPTPPAIVEAGVAACRDPKCHHYSPTAGLPALREAIANKTLRDSGFSVTPAQVLVTNGAKHALANAFATLLDPGDEVLVIAPYWTTYPESVQLAAGVPVFVPTDETTDFMATPEALASRATPRTKVLLFNSPANPSGTVYPRPAMAAIGRLAAERGWWVVTDEIYEHLVYDGAERLSLPVVAPEAAERCVVLNSVSKTFAMTGWRVGWMIGPKPVIAAATNLQSQETSNVNNVAQVAALAALTGDLASVAAMHAAFERRRRSIHRLLNEIPGVTCTNPRGAFYAFPSLAGVLGRELRGRRAATTLELAEIVLDEVNVAFVPGEAFGAPGYARFSYALSDDDLEEGVSRFAALVRESKD